MVRVRLYSRNNEMSLAAAKTVCDYCFKYKIKYLLHLVFVLYYLKISKSSYALKCNFQCNNCLEFYQDTFESS
jgi:hypothetical protein